MTLEEERVYYFIVGIIAAMVMVILSLMVASLL